MVQIKGIEKLTLIDYPGHIASILFLGGCNFRCDYCYNKDIVLRPNELPNIAEDEVLSILAQRQGFVDGVVITGGEPTVQTKALLELLPKIHDLGFKIKFDSNGYLPDRLQQIIDTGFISYLAMDIKAPLNRYSEIVGRDIVADRITQSIKMIMTSGIEYEFRTTVWQDGFSEYDFKSMFKLVAGAQNYYIQNMYPCFTIKPLHSYEPMRKKDIEPILTMGADYVKNISLRGKWL